jgi:hypothetical protein
VTITDEEYAQGIAEGWIRPHGQMALPLAIEGVAVDPTISMLRGEQVMTQCARCGLACCVPDCGDYTARDHLGACPRCGCERWWRQSSFVGGFVPASDPNQGSHRDIVDQWLATVTWNGPTPEAAS